MTFTSGLREYAAPIIDQLDPNKVGSARDSFDAFSSTANRKSCLMGASWGLKQMIKHRLYREHAHVLKGIHVKVAPACLACPMASASKSLTQEKHTGQRTVG